MGAGQATAYVFLSYASPDRDRAMQIAELLEGRGISVWIDRQRIAGGTSWSAEIVEGIKACAALVVLISPAAVASPNVQQELQLAWENRRPLLPLVLVASPLPSVIQYVLAGRQSIDVLDHPDDAWLPRTLDAFRRLGVLPSSDPPGGPRTVAAELASLEQVDRPPSRATLALPRHNLPEQLTSFVGREAELAEVERLVTANRLVTLTGPGGVGKTRLALQVAAHLIDRFPDGVFFVPLAPLSDPVLVLPTIAQSLKIPEEPGKPLLDTMCSSLGEKTVLLVLDNCEHVAEAMLAVPDLLKTCRSLRILATSRASLQLSGEHIYLVEPLSVPRQRILPSVHQLSQFTSIRLFVQRAQAVRAAFTLTHENARAIAEICARLDGLPLAIELAAARVRLLPPQALLARLEQRLPLLAGGTRDVPDRHRTMRAAISWSYDLLHPAEQRLFCRLGVFRGGCDLKAVESVCGADGENDDLIDRLEVLVGESLVHQADESAHDGPRLDLLQTIQEFALEKLTERGETSSIRERHAAYYLSVAAEASRHLLGPDQVIWLDRLERDHDNLRTALRWAIEREDAAGGMRLAASLSYLWYYRGYFSEGRTLRAAVLTLPAGPDLSALRAELLQGIGMLALRQGDYPAARAYLDEGVAIARRVADPRLLAPTLATLGFVARVQDDYVAARPALEEALTLARLVGDTFHTAMALHHLGLLALEADREVESAWSLNEQSLALYQQIGNRRMVGVVLGNMGRVARAQGDRARARALLIETVKVLGDVGDLGPMPQMLYTLAAVAADEGRLERAVRLQAAATKMEETVGTRVWPANRRERDGWLGSARAALGEASFARAWAEGDVMTREQAIAYALEETDI